MTIENESISKYLHWSYKWNSFLITSMKFMEIDRIANVKCDEIRVSTFTMRDDSNSKVQWYQSLSWEKYSSLKWKVWSSTPGRVKSDALFCNCITFSEEIRVFLLFFSLTQFESQKQNSQTVAC